MMKDTLKASLRAVLYVAVFLLLQLLASAIFLRSGVSRATALVLASGASSFLAVVLFALLGWSRAGWCFFREKPFPLLFWTCLAAAAMILPLQYAEDFLAPSMPDYLEKMFESIINHPGGYLVLGIIAPVAEETVFRGAFLRRLLDTGCHTWAAVAVSAAVFGLVHGNSAQFSHAFLVGLFLGWLYAETKSVVPCVAVHWVNNSLAFILMRIFPDRASESVTALFGGAGFRLYFSLAFSAAVLAVSFYGVFVCLKKRKEVCRLT